MMWGLDGKDRSWGAKGCKDQAWIQRPLDLASWMARTARTNSLLPILFSSFIWVGEWEGAFSLVSTRARILIPWASAGLSPSIALLFPSSCLHPGVVGRVGWGGATFFFFLPLRLSTEKGTFSGGGGWGWW